MKKYNYKSISLSFIGVLLQLFVLVTGVHSQESNFILNNKNDYSQLASTCSDGTGEMFETGSKTLCVSYYHTFIPKQSYRLIFLDAVIDSENFIYAAGSRWPNHGGTNDQILLKFDSSLNTTWQVEREPGSDHDTFGSLRFTHDGQIMTWGQQNANGTSYFDGTFVVFGKNGNEIRWGSTRRSGSDSGSRIENWQSNKFLAVGPTEWLYEIDENYNISKTRQIANVNEWSMVYVDTFENSACVYHNSAELVTCFNENLDVIYQKNLNIEGAHWVNGIELLQDSLYVYGTKQVNDTFHQPFLVRLSIQDDSQQTTSLFETQFISDKSQFLIYDNSITLFGLKLDGFYMIYVDNGIENEYKLSDSSVRLRNINFDSETKKIVLSGSDLEYGTSGSRAYVGIISLNVVSDYNFSTDLNITNSNQTVLPLAFGVSDSATDGYDDQLDQLAPPAPPTGTFDARFSYLSEEYYKDFRPTPLTETTWALKLSLGTALPGRISWDSESLPTSGSLTLKDAINESFVNVDMRAVNFVDITQDFLTQFTITYKINQEVELSYADKWNLIGLPVVFAHDSYEVLLPDALSRTLFNYTDIYTQQETLEPGKGYWVRMQQAGSTTLRGAPIESLNLELQAGWNLISGPSESVAVSSIEDTEGIIISGSIFGFNGSYVNATSIEPGQGYWVRTNQVGTVTLRGGTASKSTQSHPSMALSGFDRIEFLSGSENKPISMLYLNGSIPSPYSTINFELPPIPPSGNVDVRWEDGSYVSESSRVVALIQQGTSPLMINVHELSAEEVQAVSHAGLVSIREFMGDQLIKEVQIQRGELFTLSGQTNRIEFELQEKADLPTEFSLDQNYPNPFNPTTTIRFGLPESADVTLEVYTVLGQKIMTLVNENRSTGWHTVSFNGAELSSGVYIYRIQAGGMVQTRKLMLVK